ncbi:MAG: FecR domain-containing protein [Candidatus Accumulibacter sp.]|jgi:hypothetical protein|nr:FecR domain-containing protein [Accumulibacter sp.]
MKRARWNGKAWTRGCFGIVLACWLGLAAGADAGRIVLVVGEARMDGRAVGEGETVPEGAELSTGADGYLYLKTVDNGFLILRPGSVATVVAYRVDESDPKNSRFKFSLRQGVARSISGEAVDKAKENFRFNTPVAAIGVRGTDFSIYADARETRLVVFSGGVIVSGFDASCHPGGDGPCEGEGSKEFFAGMPGVLQIQKEENMPRIVKDKSLSPDFVTPPRLDEPAVSDGGQAEGPSGASEALSTARDAAGADAPTQDSAGQQTAGADTPTQDSAGQQTTAGADASPTRDVPAAPSSKPDSTAQDIAGADPLKQITVDQEVVDLDPLKQSQLQPVIWGRWQAISEDLPATVDIVEIEEDREYYVMISNDHYLVWRNKENAVMTPASGGLRFSLADSQAHVEGAFGQVAASVTGGSLGFDFDRALFSTELDLSTQGQDYHLYAHGGVSSNGVFQSHSAMTGNMEATGFLSETQGEMSASYIFQSTLPEGAKASGVTFWDRPVAP